MHLLFDQNVSFRVIPLLSEFYPNAKQVRMLGLENASDSAIWEFARNNQFSIVTFDADFFDLANINGHPPKVIWMRTGNSTTKNIADILIKKRDEIHYFITSEDQEDIACLEIS